MGLVVRRGLSLISLARLGRRAPIVYLSASRGIKSGVKSEPYAERVKRGDDSNAKAHRGIARPEDRKHPEL